MKVTSRRGSYPIVGALIVPSHPWEESGKRLFRGAPWPFQGEPRVDRGRGKCPLALGSAYTTSLVVNLRALEGTISAGLHVHTSIKSLKVLMITQLCDGEKGLHPFPSQKRLCTFQLPLAATSCYGHTDHSPRQFAFSSASHSSQNADDLIHSSDWLPWLHIHRSSRPLAVSYCLSLCICALSPAILLKAFTAFKWRVWHECMNYGLELYKLFAILAGTKPCHCEGIFIVHTRYFIA